ncbi:substrate-binding domain-containing protein [Ruficoccus amylovorans]|uniref:Substrate-binding domain-containing protein n=1 Tax=Ruficoccus amylovorans TaxID=1804625 RepID=A0A842HBL2_9BACT|nr:substrate-binding domain-containing protein [Ruficoccus amylovorans]MBC2593458.1 substrate-binding domain-containing protein [Ruficoccus amylovorans]
MPVTAFKSDPLVRLMRRRVKDGYYEATPIPSERRLSAESGLSLTCVRRAIAQLVDEGYLERNGSKSGKLMAARKYQCAGQKFQALLLSPVTGGLSAHLWQEGVYEGVRCCNGLLRVHHFLDEDDPALLSMLGQSFDIIFFIPPDNFSEVLRNRLMQCRNRIFTLFRDLTDQGLSMISDVSASAMLPLLDHLSELGHKTIDCVHCRTGYREYEERIKIWRRYLDEHGLRGQLWDCSTSNERGEQRMVTSSMRNVFIDGRTDATAMLGLSVITGWGLARAITDAQLRIPQDVSLAVFGPAEHGSQSVPSITSLQQPAVSEMVRRAIERFQTQGLEETVVIEPDRVALFKGESTGAPSH